MPVAIDPESSPAPPPTMPAEVWESCTYTKIHCAVLFADLENSVMVSSALSPEEYDDLVNSFQGAMLSLVRMLQAQGAPIGEFSAVGDQLTVFFYEAAEVERNFQLDGPQPLQGEARTALIALCKQANERLVFSALKAAIQLKHIWLTQGFSVERAKAHRTPLSLGVGIHLGQVYLRDRADGRRRIEGNTVNVGKRIESFARMGRYSHIMFSQQARDAIRSSVVWHTQLRQRVFFEHYLPSMELLKGVSVQQHAYELKFYHRLGVALPEGAYEQYALLFGKDRTNLWAYYQLFDFQAYQQGNWEAAFELAKQAEIVHPEDEKVQLDLAKCYREFGQLEQSLRFAQRALKLNHEFDLAYEHLAEVYAELGDPAGQVSACRNSLLLSPNSALNNLNLGLSLLNAGEAKEGAGLVERAVRLYPDYPGKPPFVQGLRALAEHGKLPLELQRYIDPPA